MLSYSTSTMLSTIVVCIAIAALLAILGLGFYQDRK